MAQVLNNPVVIVGGGGGDNLWADFITNKGTDWSYMFVNFAGDSVSQYLTGQDSSNVTNTSYMFSKCRAIISIPDFNTSNVTNMDSMFFYCENLRTAPTIDTSKNTDMDSMFQYCRALESIPAYDTSKVTKFNSTFDSCKNLISVPFVDLSSATDVGQLFGGCQKLKTIEVTSWEKVTSIYSAGSMCVNCYSLKDFIIRNATKAPIISGGGFDSYNSMFKGCYHFIGKFHYEYNPRGLADARIYIKDELVDTLKAAANWSTYADFIYPESSYNPNTVDPLTKFGPAVGESALDFSKVLSMVDGHYELKQRAVAIYFNIPADNSVSKLTIEYDSSIAGYSYELFGSVIDFDQNYNLYLNLETAQYYVPRSEVGTTGSMVYDNLPVGDHWVVFRYFSYNPSNGGPMMFNITFE